MPKKRCAVFGCGDLGNQHHRFPQEPQLRKKWAEALSTSDIFEPKPHSLVCSKHFFPTDYRDKSVIVPTKDLPSYRRRLKDGVVPTRFLVPENAMELPKLLMSEMELKAASGTLKTYCSPKQKALVQEVVVKSELCSSNELDPMIVGSSTDEVLEIPTEEVIIKEEVFERDCEVEDPLEIKQEESVVVIDDEDEEEKPSSETGSAKGWRFVSDIDVAVAPINKLLFNGPSEVKQEAKRAPFKLTTLTEDELEELKLNSKKSITDFSLEDMKNPTLAAEFYALATSLIKNNPLSKDNRLLRVKNNHLRAEIASLKRQISENSNFPEKCPNCSKVPPKYISNRLGPLKRETKTGPSTGKSSLRQERSPESFSLLRQELTVAKKPKKTVTTEIPKPKKPKFSGTYRIVELEYFIKAITDMQYSHSVKCKPSKMLMTSETLAGITGEWSFRCTHCRHTKTITTDQRSSGSKIGGPDQWLGWLQRFGPWSYVEETFEKINVPFHYAVTPTTLDVIEFKRVIASDDWPSFYPKKITKKKPLQDDGDMK